MEIIRSKFPERFLSANKIESKEQEYRPETNVVRAFLLQEKTGEEIKKELKKGVLPKDLYFTKSVWILKTGKENSGQLMPVGGKIESSDLTDSEDVFEGLDKAIKREMLHETHLRVVSLEAAGRQNYSFEHSSRGQVDNNVFLFLARILPNDIPYPLDPEEDKFERFINLDLNQVAELLYFGKVVVDGIEMKLLDSFILDDEIRTQVAGASKTKIEENGTTQSLMRFANQMSAQEGRVKLNVLEKLFSILRLKENLIPNLEEKIKTWEQSLTTVKDLVAVNRIYQEIMESEFIKPDYLLEAVGLNNLEEEVKYMDDSKAKVLLHFISVLFMDKEWTDQYFEMVKKEKNGYIKNFLERMQKLLKRLGLENDQDLSDFNNLHRQLLKIHSLKENNELLKDSGEDGEIDRESKIISEEEVAEALKEVFDLHYDPRELAQDADKFIKNIAEKSLLPHVDQRHGTAGKILLDEISSASLLDLLKISIYNPDNDWLKKHFSSSELRRQAIYEARRKLILIWIIDSVKQTHVEKIKLGDGPFDKMWNQLVKEPTEENVCYCVKKYEKRQNKKGQTEEILVDVEIVDEEPKEGSFEKIAARTMEVEDGKLIVEVHKSVKTLDSTIRKHIILGLKDPKEISDIYRRSFVVLDKISPDGQKMSMTEMQSLEIETGQINYRTNSTDQNNSSIKKATITDVAPVIDIIKQILQNSQNKIKVLSFRPSNKMSTFGPGGNKNLRFAKFYLEHVDELGQIRTEEVQIFVPQPDSEKSAKYYHDIKIIDDAEYELSRLTDTRGRRSFVSNLYSPLIYPPITSVTKNSFNKRRG